MATLLNRFKNVAASATTIARSATPASSATSPSTQSSQHQSFIKKQLYTNPVMSVSVVLGTLGCVLPTAVFFMEEGRENERTGRLTRWKAEWEQSGEEARRQRILKEMGDRQDDRLAALRTQLQSSGKYTAPQ